MNWLLFIQTFWPILVTVASIASLAVLLWLRTQFPTRRDLIATEERIAGRIDAHQKRLDEGSGKISELDRRVSVVEEDCNSQPSRNDLNQGQAVLAGRVSSVESAIRGLEKLVGTGNEYLQLLIEQGLRGKGGPR